MSTVRFGSSLAAPAMLLSLLAGCQDVPLPLAPSQSPPEASGPSFALGTLSESLTPSAASPAQRVAAESLPGWSPSMSAAMASHANGPSYIVWQNINMGLRVFWHMNGTSWEGAQNELFIIHPEWDIVASADFTGDGQTDLVWQRRSTGDQVIWHMNGTKWGGSQNQLLRVHPDWWIVGAGDFTGDGKPDLLWQNRKLGRQVIWHMNGTRWDYQQNELPPVSPEWHIVGAGDFTGDSRPDIVLQNRNAGRQVIWHMNGTTWGGSQNELLQVSPEWHIVGASDFTGDGGADLLWQHREIGRQVIWHMNGTTWGGSQNELIAVYPEWRIATTFAASKSVAYAVGDSIGGTIASGQTVSVPFHFMAGETLDLGVFGAGTSPLDGSVSVYDATGQLLRSENILRDVPIARIVSGFVVPETGTYNVVVSARLSGRTGSFVLRTRKAGAILAFRRTESISRWLGLGTGPGQDTVWVRNLAAGQPQYEVIADSAWISTQPQSGTLAPSGGERMVLINMNPGARPLGHYHGSISFRVPGQEAWNENSHGVDLRLYDPAIPTGMRNLLTSPGYLALAPNGSLVLSSVRALLRVDPATGTSTTWVADIGAGAQGMEFAPDGSLYVAQGMRIARVLPDGSVSTAITGTANARDVAITPDGTVFGLFDQQLVALTPGGARTTFAIPFTLSIAYHPNGWIYFTGGSKLQRIHPGTGVVEEVGQLPASTNGQLLNLEVGRSGNLYGMENSSYGSILVLAANATVLHRYWPQSTGLGLVLAEGRLYGSGLYNGYGIWSVSVNDGRALP